MDNYDIHLLVSEEFSRRLSSLKSFFREIDKVIEFSTGNVLNLYCLDIKLESNKNASLFMKNLKNNKEDCMIVRNEFTRAMSEKRLNLHKIFRFDPEITFIRPKYLNTFVRYFQFAYDFYLIKNYKKCKEALTNALLFHDCDKRSKALNDRVEYLLRQTTDTYEETK
jgi:hypothetical protein